jgi:hypothetical protein
MTADDDPFLVPTEIGVDIGGAITERQSAAASGAVVGE